MFGLRRRLEAWRSRPSQPTDPSQAQSVAQDSPALTGLVDVPVTDATGQAEALMRRLEWTVIRRLDGQLQGDYRTLFRGAGLMLADLREYQAHDDVRHIDWNVTARMQTPYVREHQEDREMAAWFLVDLSRSVAFGSGATSKRMLAAEVVGVLARMLTRRGNRVGAMVYTGEHAHAEFHIPARSGRRHMLHLLQTVMQAQPDVGLVLMEDAETGEQLLVDTHDAAFRERFAQAANQREADLRAALVRAGVDGLELHTDQALDEALMRFTQLRKRRSQVAAGATASAMAVGA